MRVVRWGPLTSPRKGGGAGTARDTPGTRRFESPARVAGAHTSLSRGLCGGWPGEGRGRAPRLDSRPLPGGGGGSRLGARLGHPGQGGHSSPEVPQIGPLSGENRRERAKGGLFALVDSSDEGVVSRLISSLGGRRVVKGV